MNRLSTLIVAVALPVAFAAPAFAQDGRTLGTVVTGNTTIEFRAADSRDIDQQKLQTWVPSRASTQISHVSSLTTPRWSITMPTRISIPS